MADFSTSQIGDLVLSLSEMNRLAVDREHRTVADGLAYDRALNDVLAALDGAAEANGLEGSPAVNSD